MRRLCKSFAVRAQVLLKFVPVGTVHSKQVRLRTQTISFWCAACGPAARAGFRCRSRLYTYRRSILCAHRLVVENHSFLSLASLVQNHHRRGTVCTPNSKISRRHTRPVDIGRPSPPQDANTDRFLRLYSAAVAFSAGCLCWLPMGNYDRAPTATRSRRTERTECS